MPPSDPARVSIRDIAKHVGVSIMTVSLSLRNHPKISEATRRRIQAVAAEMGYRPDPEIARLMTRLHERRQRGSGMPVAIVDLSHKRSTARLDYGERVRRGAVQRAEALGYIPSCFRVTEYDGDLTRLLSVLRHRGITGILLQPPLRSVELPAGLDWSGFAVLSATYAINPQQFHCVVPHQFLDMCRLIGELERRGFKRIGAVFESNFDERTHHHFTAAMKLHAHGENIHRTRSLEGAGRAELLRWLRAARLDVLICHFAPEVKAALAGQPGGGDLPMPKLVSLGAVDDPAIAFWDERPEEIGSAAASLLTDMMLRHEAGIPESQRTTLIHGVFHPGPLETVLPKPAAVRAGRRSAVVA